MPDCDSATSSISEDATLWECEIKTGALCGSPPEPGCALYSITAPAAVERLPSAVDVPEVHTVSVALTDAKRAALKPTVKLQPHQQELADEMAEDKETRKLLYHTLGSGKTLSSIAGAEAAEEPYAAITPASLRQNFRKEIDKWTDNKTPVSLLSYTGVAKKLPDEFPSTLIMDEAHRLRNPDSAQARNAAIMADHARRLLVLSGSPVVNRPSDFAPLLSMLTRHPVTPRQFDEAFVGTEYHSPGILGWLRGVRGVTTPTIKNKDVLEKMLKGHISYYSPAVSDVTRHEEHYATPMSPEQVGLYDAFWDRLPWLMRWKLQQAFPLTHDELRNMSSFMAGPRQVSLSTLPFMRNQADPWTAFQQSPKLQKAHELMVNALQENPRAQGAVFSNFINAGLLPYAEALRRSGIPFSMFHGGLNDKERKAAVEAYNTGKSRVMLLGPSGGEGISLRGTRVMQILDPHWNTTRTDQAIGRAVRFDSHTHLPPEERNVRIQRFTSRLPAGIVDRAWRWLTRYGDDTDVTKPGVDTYLADMANKKTDLNSQFLDVLQHIGEPQHDQ